MFVLDTDHIGILQRQSEPDYGRLMTRLAEHPSTRFYVTIISFHKQFLGWNCYIGKARKQEQIVGGYERLQKIVADFDAAQVLPFDTAAATEFDALRKQKIRVGRMDLRIAAVALTRSMTVLTRNISDFGKVPGLTLDDWTLAQEVQ